MTPINHPRLPTMIEIASPDVCDAVCREIYAQRAIWRGRRLNNQRPFYTLGAASYLDLAFERRPIDEYLLDAASYWGWAGHAVRTVVERVCRGLEDHLGEPVEYPPTLPPPGFHLFIGAGIPRSDCIKSVVDCGSVHFDLQYQYIPWDRWYASVDLANTISFTLPVKLPAGGGGLTYWEALTPDRVAMYLHDGAYDDVASIAHDTPATNVAYSVGSMFVHDGHVLHQITGIPRTNVTDERVTLQGHGVWADGAWRLYW